MIGRAELLDGRQPRCGGSRSLRMDGGQVRRRLDHPGSIGGLSVRAWIPGLKVIASRHRRQASGSTIGSRSAGIRVRPP